MKNREFWLSVRLMKLTGCFVAMMFLLFTQNSFAQNSSINLDFQDAPVSKVMQKIESQSSFKFFYNSDIDVTQLTSVQITSSDIEKIMAQVVKGLDIDYKITGQRIVLFVKDSAPQEQSYTITGTIRDESGPIVGAVISSKDGHGAVTDLDGHYQLDGVQIGDVLEASCLGYETQEIVFDGKQTSINVILQEDTTVLDEVVVTALGIRKEAKALSYNVQDLSANEITGVKDANFVTALSGKVAGIVINSSSAGIGGGAKVVMRGAKSISGNNNALYVIDGIPMPQLSTTQPTDYYTGMGQSGDGASMINPEDIENISVLSGAAASALYGSDAANGVIMITTKKGTVDKTVITYTNNTMFMSPLRTPEFQNTYGATEGSLQSWGSQLATPSDYDPLDFYQTGWNETNSLTLSTGNAKNQTFISLASTNAEGIVDNNTLDRYNVTFRNTSTFFKDKVKLDLSASYMNVREQNMVSEGQYFNPIVATYLMSPSYGLERYQLYEMYDTSRGFKTQYWPWGNMGIGMQNPYWTVNRDLFVNHKNRFLMSAGLSWEIWKGITLSGRAKLDYTSSIFEKKYYASTDSIFAGTYGYYGKNDENTRQIYADVLLNIDKYFGDFSLAANIGASIKDEKYDYYSVGSDLNSVANVFTLQNLNQTNMELDQLNYHDQTQSLFATAQVGWAGKLYLDLTGRIDWSSALAYSDYNNVAYPSVGISAILTELLPIKNKVLTFLKIRGSYSEVGNTPTRYITFQTHPFSDGSPTTTSTYPNSDIRPERTKAWEVGLQTKLWEDKFGLNLSLYKSSTYNQLFNPTLSSSSGYSSIYINGGKVDNKGIELSVDFDQNLGPVNWNTTFTYTLNRNKIKKLLSETTLENGTTVSQDVLDLYTIGNMKTRLVEGGSIGDIYVTTLARDSHGYVIVDYVNNTVSVDSTSGDQGDGWVYAGNSEPKYSMGWRNTFSWNGLSLSFVINARIGGICTSMTQAMMDAYGVSQTTADARDAGGVMINGYKVPNAQGYYQTVGTSVGENYVYSATNVRLGELSLGYEIPMYKWTNWIQSINVAFTGRNLFFFYCKAPYDPELTPSTDTHFSGMDYFMMPSLRSLGFSVKLTF